MESSSTILSSKLRDLLPPALGLLVLVWASSVVDMMVASVPFHTDDIRWRYQLMQLVLMSGTQMGLFVALFMLVGTLADHRLTVRLAAVAAVVFGVLYLIIIPFFALDFVVARRLIAVNARSGFDIQTAKIVAYVGVLSIGLLWCGYRGIRSTPKPDQDRKRELGEGLVVGQG